MGRAHLAVALLLAASTVACATAPPPPPPPPPEASGPPPLPELSSHQMTEELDALIAEMVARDPDNPLRNPEGLDDALACLRSDRLDLFEPAILSLAGSDTVEGKAMEAQLMLARADAESVVAATLIDLGRIAWTEIETLQNDSTRDLNTARELKKLRQSFDQNQRRIVALQHNAAVHRDLGAKMARKVAEEWPDSYLGHRVVADALRMQAEWPAFEEAVKKVEAHNPDSNGLRYLKGMAAFQDGGEGAVARALLKKAIEVDPEFNRARSQLVLITVNPGDRYDEYQTLAERAPNHQLVILAGDLIEASYARWRTRARQDERESAAEAK